MKKLLFLSLAIIATSVQPLSAQEALAVFTSSTAGNRVVNDFNQNYLDDVKKLSKRAGLEVKVYDAKDGLPAEVTSLPAFYYFGKGKQEYYKGRYSYVDKIYTFINNQRSFDFEDAALSKEKIFVYEDEGFEIGLVLKYFEPNGTPPDHMNMATVQLEIINGLKASMKTFSYHEKYAFKAQSKLYYLNVYPYCAADGKWYVSTEIFSQHSCVDPVFKKIEYPFVGNGLQDACTKIGPHFESLITELMSDIAFHDGLYIVPEATPRKSFSDLGLTPSMGYGETTMEAPGPMANGSFKVQPGSDTKVNFTFLPPVSHYAGAIPSLSGDFSYEGGKLSGNMTVELSGLDMGDKSLNKFVKDGELKIEQFPATKLHFNTEVGEITYSEPVSIPATLELIGQEEAITIRATFMPTDKDGTVQVEAGFTFNVTPFPSLEKPDGPSPQNETMMVATKFLAGSGSGSGPITAGPIEMTKGLLGFHSEKMNLDGTSEEFNAWIDPVAKVVKVELALETLEFPSDGYKKHALGKSGLQAEQHPDAVYLGSFEGDDDLTVPGEYQLTLKGELTLHGKTLPTDAQVTLINSGGQYTASAEMIVDREGHELKGSRAKLVDKMMKVTVEATF